MGGGGGLMLGIMLWTRYRVLWCWEGEEEVGGGVEGGGGLMLGIMLWVRTGDEAMELNEDCGDDNDHNEVSNVSENDF